MAKNNKNLLNEVQITKFMKLANLEPLTPGFVHGLREADEVKPKYSDRQIAAAKNRFQNSQHLRDLWGDVPGGWSSDAAAISFLDDRAETERAAAELQGKYDASSPEEQAEWDAAREYHRTGDIQPLNTAVFGAETAEEFAGMPADESGKKLIVRDTPRSTEDAPPGVPPTGKEVMFTTEPPEPEPEPEEVEEVVPQQESRRRRRRIRESHARGQGELASGKRRKDNRRQSGDGVREQLEMEDELEMDVPLEGDVDLDVDVEDVEDVEVLDEPADDLEGADVQVSIDDFLSALERALEDVLGEEVEVAQEEEEEELEDLEGLEDEAELDADLDVEAVGLEDEELALQERRLNHLMRALQEKKKKRQKSGGNKGDESKSRPDYMDEAKKVKKMPQRLKDAPAKQRKKWKDEQKKGDAKRKEANESLNVDALVNRITARVAKRIVGESLKRK